MQRARGREGRGSSAGRREEREEGACCTCTPELGMGGTATTVALALALATTMALEPPSPGSKKEASLPPCGACTNLVTRSGSTRPPRLHQALVVHRRQSGAKYMLNTPG